MLPVRASLSALISCTLAVAPTSAAAEADLKDAVNASVRALRATQQADGSYGMSVDQPLVTARVLQGMGFSHEHYTAQDGPFVRDAVEALLRHQEEDGGFGEGSVTVRAHQTAQALIALRGVAPAGYDPAIQAGREFLSSLDDEVRAVAGSVVSIALSDASPINLASVRPYLTAEEAGTTPDRWLSTAADRIAAEQREMIAALSPSEVKEVADRLLALIALYAEQQKAASSGESATPAAAATPRRSPPTTDEARTQRRLDALAFLGERQTDGRFGIGEFTDPGITAIALSAAIKTSDQLGLERPAYIESGLDYLVSLQKEDGGIYDLGLKNYVTSAAIEALVAAGDPDHKEVIQRATEFLLVTQLDEAEGYSSEEDPYYGGFGYGSSEKPDLSNTQMALQAMKDAGVEPSHEAFQKAIWFLQRTQNLEETGAPPMTKVDGTVVVPGADGGAIYRPGDSKAGTEEIGPNRRVGNSYGSMTYALLKSYLFAGLDPEDDRVAAAIRWIQENFTLEVNPGFEQSRKRNAQYQGLYYYYLTLARALAAYGEEEIIDGTGTARDWRSELRDTLFSQQAEEGYWVNDRSSRWMEGNSVLATAYSLLALVETR